MSSFQAGDVAVTSSFPGDSTYSPPTGFVLYEYAISEGRRHFVVRLFLPSGIKEKIQQERAAKERAAAEQSVQTEPTQNAPVEGKPVRSATPVPSKPASLEWWAQDPFLKDMYRTASGLHVAEPEPRNGQVRVYSLKEVAIRVDELQPSSTAAARDSGNKARDRTVFDKLRRSGPLRPVGSPSRWRERLDRLEGIQPHFSDDIHFLRGRFAQAEASRQPLFIPPILLVGEPGSGKTHFALELAQVLGVSTRRHAMDSADTSAALMGSHKSWSGTTVGLVFEEVCLGKHANPLIILDELDKAAENRYGNPLGPLHTLLESVTSQKVRDLSLDFEFDARYVTWVATANDTKRIPPPLVSRFEVFEIPMPTPEQSLILARHVANTTVKKAAAGLKRPGNALVSALAKMTPREMKQVLNRAIGQALLAGRRTLQLRDLQRSMSATTTRPMSEHRSTHLTIGFGTFHPDPGMKKEST